ncbi:RtcB family protein [Streptosporangium subroseum]|uniref:RtcB family protein n=1 Tax=Streptosporangium subroseum TaxID=106412 RepID=UPI0034130767
MPRQVAPGLLSWANDTEPGTIEQAARLPFVPSHVAPMAGAHVGMGATVGSVIPIDGAIIASAVGADIGRGMAATETTLTAADLPDTSAALMPLIEEPIPADGVGQGSTSRAPPDGSRRGAEGVQKTPLAYWPDRAVVPMALPSAAVNG